MSEDKVIRFTVDEAKKNLIIKLVSNLKSILVSKGGVIWKLPLILYIIKNYSQFFVDIFLRLQFIFSVLSNGFTFGGTKEGREAYFKAFEENFYESGIEFIPMQIFALLTVLLFAKIVDRLKNSDLGIKINVKAIFLLFGGAILSFFVVTILCSILINVGNLEFVGFTKTIGIEKDNFKNMIIFQGILFFIVAFQEELFARAYIINNIKWTGKYVTIFLASLSFGILHIENISGDLNIASFIGVFNIGIIAVLFSLYYWKYKEIWFIVGAHFGWNFSLGPIYGLTVSNIEKLEGLSFLKMRIFGEIHMTGGEFGPEGSIFTTMVLLLVLLVVGIIRESLKRTQIEKSAV